MSEDIKTQQESNPLNPSESVVKKGFGRSKLLILILLFVLLLVVLVYVITGTTLIPKDSKLGFLNLKSPEELEGEIYLTLSPLGEEKPNIYKLDLETMELEEYFKDSEYRNYMANFSSDLKKMVFVRAYEDDSSQLILLNEKTGEVSEIGTRSTGFIRNPKFSPDNQQIVYWTFEGTASSFGDNPEDNSIYIISLDGSKEKITNGSFPLFTPDGNGLLFMKNDGLYIFDLSNKTEAFALEIRIGEELKELLGELEPRLAPWLAVRFNVFAEDNLLIATNTVTSKINIFKINSWFPFSYERLFDVNFYAPNWPVFSQNGGYFAIQEFVSQPEGETGLPHLGVYNSETLEKEVLFSLENYELNNIWVTDWIIK